MHNRKIIFPMNARGLVYGCIPFPCARVAHTQSTPQDIYMRFVWLVL